jgi:hypothetical protein
MPFGFAAAQQTRQRTVFASPAPAAERLHFYKGVSCFLWVSEGLKSCDMQAIYSIQGEFSKVMRMARFMEF